MRLHTLCASATLLAMGVFAGCNGQIGAGDPGDSTGTGSSTGSGTGGTTGGSGTGGSIGGTGTGGSSGSGTGGSSGTGSGGSSGTGSGGSSGTGTGGSSGGVGTGLDLDGSPQYSRMVRLTNQQWARAVQDVLKLASPSGLEVNFQDPVTGTTDFSNNELVLQVDQTAWDNFQTAAETLANQVTATDAALAKVYTGTDAAGFITTVGRRVYRRPLTSAEQSAYMTLYNGGSSLMGSRSTFAKGASLVLRAMLQSPYFLYRTELGAKGSALNGYEMAAKLSLFLRGTTPSDSLLDSASGSGNLNTADGAGTMANTMLGESTATAVFRGFHDELLHVKEYGDISKMNVPSFTTALNQEFIDSSNAFFDKIFTAGQGLKQIYTATSGFVGPKMAALYGVTAPSSGVIERDLGANRVGYFEQLPFLTLYGLNGDPDSIHRGVSLNHNMLCAKLGPPAAVIPPIPPLQPGQTNRQRIDTLTATCGMECHNNMINPLGFAFEHYDGMGQYRDTENGGLTIDSSGSYAFIDGTKTFNNATDLMNVLANEPQSHLCYSKKLASYGLQRDIVAGDMSLLQSMADSSMATTGSIKQMVVSLVKSDAFRTRVGGN